MARNIVYGYIDAFAGVSLNTATVIPIECRLRSGQSARVITLVNGAAHNLAGTTASPVRYPVEQRLKVVIRSLAGGAVDNALGAIDNKLGVQGSLRVRVPDQGAEVYECVAVLDEIVEDNTESTKADAVNVINTGTYTLVFQQLTAWTVR